MSSVSPIPVIGSFPFCYTERKTYDLETKGLHPVFNNAKLLAVPCSFSVSKLDPWATRLSKSSTIEDTLVARSYKIEGDRTDFSIVGLTLCYALLMNPEDAVAADAQAVKLANLCLVLAGAALANLSNSQQESITHARLDLENGVLELASDGRKFRNPLRALGHSALILFRACVGAGEGTFSQVMARIGRGDQTVYLNIHAPVAAQTATISQINQLAADIWKDMEPQEALVNERGFSLYKMANLLLGPEVGSGSRKKRQGFLPAEPLRKLHLPLSNRTTSPHGTPGEVLFSRDAYL